MGFYFLTVFFPSLDHILYYLGLAEYKAQHAHFSVYDEMIVEKVDNINVLPLSYNFMSRIDIQGVTVSFGKPEGTYITWKRKFCMKSCLLENWRGYAVLKITKKHIFQADILDKITDGINNPTMETDSIGLDKKNLNTIYCLFSKLRR